MSNIQVSYKKLDEYVCKADESVEKLSHLCKMHFHFNEGEMNELENYLKIAQEQLAIFRQDYAAYKQDINQQYEAWRGSADDFEPVTPKIPLERYRKVNK